MTRLAKSADDICQEIIAERDAALDQADRYRLAPYKGTFRFEALERAVAERDAARADADRLAAVLVRVRDGVRYAIPLADALAAHNAEVAGR